MDAPEKLYLSQIIYGTYQYQVPDPDDDTQVEYVRKDALLEKVCEWIEDNYLKYPSEDCADTANFVRDLKKHLEE